MGNSESISLSRSEGRRQPRAAATARDRPTMTVAVRTRTSTTELRVYLPIAGLRQQFAAYLGTPTRARGYPAAEGDHALIVEVAPGLAIDRVTDLALRVESSVEPCILVVERQFVMLHVHLPDSAVLQPAGQ